MLTPTAFEAVGSAVVIEVGKWFGPALRRKRDFWALQRGVGRKLRWTGSKRGRNPGKSWGKNLKTLAMGLERTFSV
jgi:hypothetical protein